MTVKSPSSGELSFKVQIQTLGQEGPAQCSPGNLKASPSTSFPIALYSKLHSVAATYHTLPCPRAFVPAILFFSLSPPGQLLFI